MNEDGEKSIFNAGVAQAERIDSLQRAINASMFNLLALNPDTMTYNYQVVIDANNNLLNEAWAKLSKDEKEKGMKLRNLIVELINVEPPLMRVSEGLTDDVKVNHESFNKLTRLLDIYSRKIKEFLNAHDLNSPSKDEDDSRY